MANWINRVASYWRQDNQLGPDEVKKSQAHSLISLHTTGNPVWTPRNYEAFAKQGFAENAIGYRCVKMIAEAAASVNLHVVEDGEALATHPLQELLQKPNPAESGRNLLESFYSFLQISGNAYLEAATLGHEVRELHVLRPDRMKVIPGQSGWPEAYEYSVNGSAVRFDQSKEPVAPILHVKMFNPLDDHYGMSPFEAAAKGIDIHNAAGAWNKALLDNAARPSGALVYDNKGGDANLTEEQFDRLKKELETTFQGASNAGRPMVLEGGLDWKPLSHSPKDMEHIEAKHVAAREIALAFGVPPMLLGIPGDNTFANYAEANKTFWRQTVLPLVDKTSQSLNNWLSPAFGQNLSLGYNQENISALSKEREALWKTVNAAEFLTDNEKRRIAGIET
ncbi:Gene Transfer Agent portal protein [hydrothermal vent metagenome]|uniref:Gene Transfer Agent portal protein n=1 Tax=hydrothermal vent metagenome TaxID=652676 RepID=A0A3B0RVI4_9ZZZZ